MGFAIPSTMVRWVYEQLRAQGHVDRPVIGAGLQTITPTLAAALRLPTDSGVLVSDVLRGSPAQAAGLRIGDVLLSVDGMEGRQCRGNDAGHVSLRFWPPEG